MLVTHLSGQLDVSCHAAVNVEQLLQLDVKNCGCLDEGTTADVMTSMMFTHLTTRWVQLAQLRLEFSIRRLL